MSGVAVEKDVLRWAVARASAGSDALLRRFPKLPEWERGDSLPSLRQLEALARVTLTPLGYFFLERPPVDRLPIPYFRTERPGGAGHPSAELLATVQAMQRRQAWMHEYLADAKAKPLRFVASQATGQPAGEVASSIRHALGLDDGWAAALPTWTEAFRRLRDAAEKVGILVVGNGVVGNNTHRKLNRREFRGFVLVDELAPLVFVNAADYRAAQMFTLAHEFAHVWFGKSAAFDLRRLMPAADPTEQACNRVAAELLIPEHEMRREWPRLHGERLPERLDSAARHFKVSVLVAGRRALDLDLIGRDAFFRFYGEYEERQRAEPRHEGGDFYATQTARIGERFANVVLQAVREGKLLYRDAYDLTGLYGSTFDRYFERLQ